MSKILKFVSSYTVDASAVREFVECIPALELAHKGTIVMVKIKTPFTRICPVIYYKVLTKGSKDEQIKSKNAKRKKSNTDYNY